MSLDETTRTASVAAEAELALYRNRVSALEAELAAIQARLLTKLAMESEEVQAVIAASLTDANYNVDVLEHECNLLKIELEAVRAGLAVSVAGEQLLRSEKDALVASFSWRITRPLRWALRKLPLLQTMAGATRQGRAG